MAKRRRKKSKPVTQQVKAVNDRYKKTVANISAKQEAVVTKILIVIQGNAAFFTPQDTNALINSQYRQIIGVSDNVTIGRVGYTQRYAAALHERDDWIPRKPSERSPEGGAYNPNASSKFLEKGALDSIDDIKTIIKRDNKI